MSSVARCSSSKIDIPRQQDPFVIPSSSLRVFFFFLFFFSRSCQGYLHDKTTLQRPGWQWPPALELRAETLVAASIIGTTLKRAHNDVEGERRLRPQRLFTLGLYMPYPLSSTFALAWLEKTHSSSQSDTFKLGANKSEWRLSKRGKVFIRKLSPSIQRRALPLRP